jgi:hypothetical protein
MGLSGKSIIRVGHCFFMGFIEKSGRHPFFPGRLTKPSLLDKNNKNLNKK